MRIIVANSKRWFQLDEKISTLHDVLFVDEQKNLTFEKVSTFSPDYMFFPHWNWIIPRQIHEAFECVVFHTAPLPYGRGGSPIQNLIVEGFHNAPVCALRVTEKLDAGPIYARSDVTLDGPLHDILDRICIAVNALILRITAEEPVPVEQTGSVHHFKRRTDEDNRIPNNLSLEQIFDRIRMLDSENYPNAYVEDGDKKIEFHSAEITDGNLVAKCRISKCR